MKRRVWVGGLVLSLGGWASDLHAQEVVWRPVPRQPAAIVPADPVPGAGPQVSLGRPVPLEKETRTVVTVSYREASALLPPTVRAQSADAQPASASPATEDGQNTDDNLTDFAIDRLVMAEPETKDPITLVNAEAKEAPKGKAAPITEDDPFPGVQTGPRPPRFQVRGEYLLWWIKTDNTPPLVTTSLPQDNGFLGAPSTRVLLGGTDLHDNPHSGARVTADYWFDDCHDLGLDLSGFVLPRRSAHFEANSAFFPLLARPFFNLNTNMEFAQIVTAPGVSTGNITVESSSELWGAEANLRCNLVCGCNFHADAFAGFRYLHLDEDLTIQENIQALPTAPEFPGSRINVTDRFATTNQFYGGQVGVISEFNRGRWFLDLRGQVALGDTRQQINIAGSQTIVMPNGNVLTANAGALALASNSGRFTQDRFSVVPEVGINLGYQLTQRLRAYIGYDFLYWSSVVRPGEQIDRVIDVTQVPNFPVGAMPVGQNRPAVLFKTSDFWTQGINFGLEFRY
jgi:hypothetical protein